MDEKHRLRKKVWGTLLASDAARFPGVEGRIPNFRGAEAACAALTELPAWRKAQFVKANPDIPSRKARYLALEAGKTVYLAVPRLRDPKPFIELDPAHIDAGELWHAASIRGAEEHGRPVSLREMSGVDLIVTGCVAASADGARIGKGGGFADLEYALLREAGLANARTPVVSVLHPLQLLPKGRIPMTVHDVPLDAFATPDGLVRCPRGYRRPRGILWDELDEAKRAAIPVLAKGPPGRGRGVHQARTRSNAQERTRSPVEERKRSSVQERKRSSVQERKRRRGGT